MFDGFNHCILMGNAGSDPEVRYTQDGTAVCNFSIAVTKSWLDKQSGQRNEKTSWISLTVWGKFGETVAKHVKKGTKVLVDGEYDTNAYNDKDGVKRYRTFVNVHELCIVHQIDHNEQHGQPPANHRSGHQGKPQQGGQRQTQQRGQQQGTPRQAPPAATDFSEFDDLPGDGCPPPGEFNGHNNESYPF